MLSLNNRPQLLSEMIGQTTILREMKKRSKSLEFPNYMLFEGETGSGKSTLAFIIAKTLNCKSENKPCNECEACQDIINERFRRDVPR